MLTYNNLFCEELKKRIREEVGRLTLNLTSGQMATLEAYKNTVGQIEAYNRVIEDYCDEIETKLQER